MSESESHTTINRPWNSTTAAQQRRSTPFTWSPFDDVSEFAVVSGLRSLWHCAHGSHLPSQESQVHLTRWSRNLALLYIYSPLQIPATEHMPSAWALWNATLVYCCHMTSLCYMFNSEGSIQSSRRKVTFPFGFQCSFV